MAYNVPSTTLERAIALAKTYIRSGIIPLFIAAPGVGKTTIAKRIAAEMGAEFRSIRLNNISPEEVSGLQYIDREGRHSIHLPPKWLRAPDVPGTPVVVFIDEISQASDENRKAIMSALLERYLGDTAVPDNFRFIAAGNSSDDGTNVYEFDRATADRFGVIRIRTNVEAWCNDYAPTINGDVTVPTFLRLRTDAFEMSEEMMKGDDVIGPSPRTWEAVMRFVVQAEKDALDEEDIILGVKGKVGEGIGEAYKVVRDQAMQLKTISELLDMKPEERRRHAPRTIDALWTYCQGMIFYATTVERMHDVFVLLDSFEDIEDVPFYEMRFNVAELMYKRAVSVHNIRGIVSERRLGDWIAKWKKQLSNNVNAVPDGTQGDGETVQMKVAA